MKVMTTACEALAIATKENKLTHPLGKESCCDWKRVKWYPGRSWHAAESHTFGPLHQGSGMALAYFRPG